MKLATDKDFLTGLIFAALGISVAVLSNHYRMGTAARMGPGYFPFWIGTILALTGVALVARCLYQGLRDRPAADNRVTGFDLKSAVLIVGAFLLFGVTLRFLGFLAAVIAVVLVSSLASHDFSWRATLANILILVVLTYVIFVAALGVPLEVLPPFLTK